MLISNTFRVEPERGAIRFWYRPDFSSGRGPGNTATLLEMVSANGKMEAVWWALIVAPKGDEVHLVCQTETGLESRLKAAVNWEAGNWNLLTLGFTPTNSAIFVDDRLEAVGGGLPPIPKELAPYTRLIVGSAVSGAEPAQGQIEELCVFSGRKRIPQVVGNIFGLGVDWEIGIYYASLSKLAALGPISAEEIAARKMLAERTQAERASLGLDESGGDVEMLRANGPVTECATNDPLYITNVSAVLISNQNWTVTFEIQGTNGPADIFATTNFSGSSITNSPWVWLERGPSCYAYQYTNQPTAQNFYILGTMLDSDGDGLTDAYEKLVSKTAPALWDTDGDGMPDGWEWENFGTIAQTADGDFDGDGVYNGLEYANQTDPNTIKFWVFANKNVNSNSTPISLAVLSGVPTSTAILVDSTNYGSAVWTTFHTNAVVNLGTTNGWHELWVGARGRLPTSEKSWQWTRVKLDTVSPLLALTSPGSTTCAQPLVQLQGFSLEALRSISFDMTNAAGLLTNQPVFITGQATDTNTWDFTTNYFQGFDILLTNGLNSIAVHAVDLAGNLTTTNLTLMLDYSSALNPPVIQIGWPLDGTKISGTNFTWDGWVDDPVATVVAQHVNSYGVTESFNALVGRDGKFWIENLPLYSGTNDWTLLATNSAGSVSLTNIGVVKSTQVSTINPVSPDSQLWQSTVNLSGTISDAGCLILVNGVQGVNHGDGTWSASNVPVSNGGTASFEATASSGTNAPTAVKLNQDKPYQVFLATANGSTFYPWPATEQLGAFPARSRWDWTFTNGGDYSFVHLVEGGLPDSIWIGEEYYSQWSTNGAGAFEHWLDFYSGGLPPDRVLWDFGTNSFSGFPREIGSLETFVPSLHTEEPMAGFLKRNSRVTVKLKTGGKGGSKLKHVFALPTSATAYQRLTDELIPQLADSWAVPLSAIQIPGATWLDNNGIAYGVYPDDSIVDITPQVGMDYYSFTVSATKYKSYLTLYARMPDPNGCEVVVGTDAGHAWWRLTTEAPSSAVSMFMGTNYSYYIGKAADFYPTTITWIFPLGADFLGVMEVPDSNQGNENAQKTYEIGFDDLKNGVFFTKHRSENPGHWNGLFRNCVHAARDAAAASGVGAPYAIFPETFGQKLRGDSSCP